MSNDTSNPQKVQGLKKSLKLIFVYTAATGAIFTFVGYWDSVFYSYCGPGTFLAFLLMTCAILPIAFVYCELAPMFHTDGGELIYNTVGMNKHMGFLASWLIMAAWISVPPAVVMGVTTWLSRTLHLNLGFQYIIIIGIVLLLLYFTMSLQDIQVLVKAQAAFLLLNISGTIITAFCLLFSGHWSFSNFTPFFFTTNASIAHIPGWIIGMALLITPFFGFETVPELVEEGNFPIKDSSKAIRGSVVTCGIIYGFFFFCLAGFDKTSNLLTPDSANGFLTITAMQNILGWKVWPVIFGILAIIFGMGASLLGFWTATVRMLYSMSKKNFLPEAFSRVNKHHQPILPNVLLLVISVTFVFLQNAGTFMHDFFNLMAFGCACAYALTMISSIRIHVKHPQWHSSYKLKGGNFTRVLALIIAVLIAIFCTLGQGKGSWISFGVYIGIGAILWLLMVLVKWKKTPVKIETPDGVKEF